MASAVTIVACVTTALTVFVAGIYIYGERSGHGAGFSNDAEPLFGRSVEQGSVSPDRWPKGRLEVPYYGPMIELLTLGASRSRPPNEGRAQSSESPKVTSAREKGREDTRRQRARTKRAPDNEMVDPGDAYARGDPQQRGRRSSYDEDEGRRSRRIHREQHSPQSRAVDSALTARRAPAGDSYRGPERQGSEQRWPSERREERGDFNLFGGFERR